jgi:ABC-2 type transport system permease protein
LDFVLLKPADAQFLVSTARMEPWRATNAVSAGILFVAGFIRLGKWPGAMQILAALALLASATLLLYSLWILTVSLAFYVVKVDNLTYLFGSIFDAARWPVTVFPPLIRLLFTFVLPLALMTTFPAQALLGKLPWTTFIGSLLGAVGFAAVARRAWLRSLASYTSASS